MSDRKKAIETLKENLCAMCAYGSQNMESCDIRSCDNRDAIKALEQEPTTKNDLGVDCVARQDIERYIEGFINEYTPKEELEFINLELDGLKHLPSVTPQKSILDKIRAEIAEYGSIMVSYAITKDTKTDKGIEKLVSGVLKEAKQQVLEIIDKYRGESEG